MTLRRTPALAFFTLGCLGDPALAQLRTDMRLEDAGFVMRPADTPQKADRAAVLPPHVFVTRNRAGKRYVLYSDPVGCKCVFVGTEQALQAYRDMPTRVPQPDNVAPGGFQPQQFVVREMAEDVIRETGDYDDILNPHF